MKILIIAPRYTFRKGDYYEFPLGLGYITAVLKRAGHNVEVLNLNQYEDSNVESVITDKLNDFSPKVVMTGGLTAFYHLILQIIDTVRIHDPSIVTVVGGGIVSSELQLMAEMLRPDFVVDGEGEVTAVELAKAIEHGNDTSTVAGIGYFKDGVFTRSLPREVMTVEEMEELPMPDFDAFGLDEYFSRQTPASEYYLYYRDDPRVLPIITSRSCPLKCTFCFHPLGNKYRMRKLESVSAEIAEMKKRYNINTLLVLDELMTGSKRRLLEFCEMMKQHDLKWVCQLWTNLIDDETVKALSDSGCYYISYGLESASDTILQSMEKHGCTVANMEEGLALTREYKIGIQGNFIFGDKNETLETAKETLDWWRKHKEYQINLSPIIPYPGSPDFRIAVENGIIKDKAEYIKARCPSINMSKMTDAEYKQINEEILREASNPENKIFGKVNSVEYTHYDSLKSARMYTIDVTCPHCNTSSTYHNFHQMYLDTFKLACRRCSQRFDLLPMMFPNNAALTEHLRAKSTPPLWLTPCLPEDSFERIMHLMGIPLDELPVAGMLDINPQKIGSTYLGKYPIADRSKLNETINEKDWIVIVPSAHAQHIRDELLNSHGIPRDRIIMLDPRSAPLPSAPEKAPDSNMAAQRNDVSWFYQTRN